jgi:hypothetical protein
MRAGFAEPFAVNPIASSPEVQKAFGKQLTNLPRPRSSFFTSEEVRGSHGPMASPDHDDRRMYFTVEGDQRGWAGTF